VQLVGLDVGFSRTRASSGVATLARGVVRVGRARATWSDRIRLLRAIRRAAVAAIDAPVLPALDHAVRPCERLLARGLFQRRCKPGFSHVPGTGLRLREAGMETARQLQDLVSDAMPPVAFPRVFDARNVVEAFPNAFLGVCVDESLYESAPPLPRGRKFDWLYDTWCAAKLFERFVACENIPLPDAVPSVCRANHDHDERAALVCLLTAACVAAGHYVAIGEPCGGYLFLPPWPLWAAWARAELAAQHGRDAAIEVWIDGVAYESGDPLGSCILGA
jgi:hypothetical protein